MIELVTTQAQLIEVCERASQRAFVILDTEFVRTRTLYPCLGLVQLKLDSEVYLLDTTILTDLSPLKALLLNEVCIKVLHSPSEDFEALLTAVGAIPTPVFDTQFAAQMLGIGNGIGFANLVKHLLDIDLDKGESRTDWLARPLTPAQTQYAANDVIYLEPVFDVLWKQMDETQKRIVLDEARLLRDKKSVKFPSEYAYLQIKNNWRLDNKQLYVLQALAKWRLERAREKDMALNFVLREGALVPICQLLPTSRSALQRISSLSPQEVNRVGKAIISLVEKTLSAEQAASESQSVVQPIKRLSELRRYKKTMAELKQCIADVADETGIAQDILSSKKQLHQLLKWFWFDIDETRVQNLQPDLLSGWRRELIGDRLCQIITNKANLSSENV